MKLLKLNEDKSLKDYEKEWEEQKGYKTCDECGTRLNDKGTCPKCDDGEEDLNESVNDSEEFKSYAAAIEKHKANGTEAELENVITSAHNDLNRETRLTGPEFNKLCDLANLPDRKIATNEAYDPQELNPDAPGPIYDLNVEFYKDLDRAVQAKDWPAAAKEWVEIRRDMDQTINDNANKPFFKRIPKFFFTPHEHTLAAYRRRIPDEYIKEAESTIVECGTMKFTESLKRILTEDVNGGWAIFATDLATGKEYCAGVYDTENNAHYWAAMDEVSDKEYGYGQFKYRVENVEEYTSDMAASANELNKLKIKNYDGIEDDGTLMEGAMPLVEKMSKAQLANLFDGLSEFYGKIVIDAEHADKILKECGEAPTGKKATLDELLAVVQKFIAGAPMATTAVIALLEAIFDVLMWAVTAGLIVIPIDGAAGELITGFLAAIPVAAIAGAIVTIPAAAANRLIMLARKALRKEDAEKVEAEVKKKKPEALNNAGQLNEKVTGNIAEEVHNILLQFIEDDDMVSAWNDGETVKKAVKDRLLNDGIIDGNDVEADSIIDAEMHKDSIRDMVYAVRVDLGLEESMSNDDTLTEDKKEFYFVEIVPGPNGKNEYERYAFSTLDEMKARVKEMSLTEEDIDSCGGCEIKQLFEACNLKENNEDDANISISGIHRKASFTMDEDDVVIEPEMVDYDDDFDLEFYN